MTAKPPTLWIVMPCYNEEAIIEHTASVALNKLNECVKMDLIGQSSSLLFVDDGSKDNTWSCIKQLHQYHQNIHGCKLAANRGKECALLAGLMHAKSEADIVICMDADLQHDINAINQFLEKYREGYDIVYGVKITRAREPFYKRCFSKLFYTLMNIMGAPVVNGHSDYSLISRHVLNALSEYNERNFMFRELLNSIGFRKCSIPFSVKDRAAGQSKFSFFRLLNLSIDAITSFSTTPLRCIACTGFLMMLISLTMIAWVIFDYFQGITPSGWATLNCSLWFLGGVSIMSLGIIGEYLGRIYMETKQRPRYYIETSI